MIPTHITKLRTRYSETDQMGYVYYGNYPQYFEVGRAELVRDLGMSYAEMERELGVIMPVVDMAIHYGKPARYDDLITITTQILEMPLMRVRFNHEIHNEQGQRIVSGHVELVFVRRDTMRPVRPPEVFLSALERIFAA
jgi:acyl-CoA thioester hydrolase